MWGEEWKKERNYRTDKLLLARERISERNGEGRKRKGRKVVFNPRKWVKLIDRVKEEDKIKTKAPVVKRKKARERKKAGMKEREKERIKKEKKKEMEKGRNKTFKKEGVDKKF